MQQPITSSYAAFWDWFRSQERAFYQVVKEQGDVQQHFFDQLGPRLHGLRDSFFYVTGMYDDDTVELIITADGDVRNIVFVEELVAAAPRMEGWRITMLKPALDIKDVNIEMGGYVFNEHKLQFVPVEHPEYPDEIDLVLVHEDLNEANHDAITTGTFIFLDNYLGELDFATTIDHLTVAGKDKAPGTPIPIGKLRDYLRWREKEFVEKYEGLRRHTDEDDYALLEAELENGHTMVAVINTELLRWEAKASHPWILQVEATYDGSRNRGMPDDATMEQLDELDERLQDALSDAEGQLYIGRQTGEGTREIYFACKDFRKPAKVLDGIQKEYAGRLALDYDIYKDKYWLSFRRFTGLI